MSSLAISLIVFACVFGSAVLGIRCVLPQSHQNADSKDAVKLGMGLVATMSALVLGGGSSRVLLSISLFGLPIFLRSIELLH